MKEAQAEVTLVLGIQQVFHPHEQIRLCLYRAAQSRNKIYKSKSLNTLLLSTYMYINAKILSDMQLLIFHFYK